jgi:hypothetical protein
MNQSAEEFKLRTAWASEEEEPFEHRQNDSGGGGGVGVEPVPKPVLSEAALYGLLGDIMIFLRKRGLGSCFLEGVMNSCKK